VRSCWERAFARSVLGGAASPYRAGKEVARHLCVIEERVVEAREPSVAPGARRLTLPKVVRPAKEAMSYGRGANSGLDTARGLASLR